MRRSIAATLALTCMGISAGVAALVGTPVSAEAPDVTSTVQPVVVQPTAERTAAKPSAAGRYSQKAHDATNKRRTEHGLKELRRTGCVQRFAVKWAKTMAAQTHMYHQELGPILAECGLNLVGENVAYGYPNGRAVVAAWMNSEGHRANILRSDYRLMGIGARKGDDGLWYVSQVFGRKA